MKAFATIVILCTTLPAAAQNTADRRVPFDDIVYVQTPVSNPRAGNATGNVPPNPLQLPPFPLPSRPNSSVEAQQVIEKALPASREVLAIDLDSVLLANAAKSVPNSGGDDEKIRKLLSGLKSIHIRGFEEAAPPAYRSRIQPIRDSLKGPQWVRYVSSVSGQNELEIWSARWGNTPTGVLMLSITEGKQVFIMNVEGEIRPDQLIFLSGALGIPNFNLPLGGR
jgi:hypothetical protein